ncbi:MAG: flagellar hook-associated protein FlgK [Oscillospiraceae bacterium]|nr:flagellar hook-associated protein FlgK [Oscillospiraceae bacterium]
MFRSTFTGLNIANTGISIAQRQLDVTAHNVSNANVEGYSRQRYINSAFPSMGWNVQFVSPQRGKEANGVESLSLDQIRDLFLDRQFRNEQTKATYWDTRSNAMYYIEDVFNSIDANSLDGVISSFFGALQELSKNSTDEAVRTNVVSQAKRMVDVIQTYDRQLTALMEQQNFMLIEKVKNANLLLTQMAALNDNIFRFELGGSIANDLRDKRALILDELSSLMDISYEYVPFEPPMYNIYGLELSQLKVYAGSQVGEDFSDHLLVKHYDAFHLVLQELEPGDNEIYDALVNQGGDFDPPYMNLFLSYNSQIEPGDTRSPAFIHESNEIKLAPYNEDSGDGLLDYHGGLLQSYLDVRDGTGIGEERIGIPYFLNELNRMVQYFVEAFNEIHQTGFPMPCEANGFSFMPGIDFFNSDGLTARTIGLSEDILLTPFNIAASSADVSRDADGHWQTGNNEIVLSLIMSIKEGIIEGLDNSIEGFYKNYLGLVASEAASANSMKASQEILLHGIHTQRTAVSSVSEDEEMTNLIRFQHAYNAASRCITSIDEMLDRLINATGRVGL